MSLYAQQTSVRQWMFGKINATAAGYADAKDIPPSTLNIVLRGNIPSIRRTSSAHLAWLLRKHFPDPDAGKVSRPDTPPSPSSSSSTLSSIPPSPLSSPMSSLSTAASSAIELDSVAETLVERPTGREILDGAGPPRTPPEGRENGSSVRSAPASLSRFTSHLDHCWRRLEELNSIGGAGVEPLDLNLGAPIEGLRSNGKDHISASGVDWRCAPHGMRALSSARQEADHPSRRPELERRLYIEGVTYLLRGLPSDLQPLEVEQLRQAAPEALAQRSNPPSTLDRIVPGEPLCDGRSNSNGAATITAGFDGAVAVANRGMSAGTSTPAPAQQHGIPYFIAHWAVCRAFGLALAVLPMVHVLMGAAVRARLHETALRFLIAACLLCLRFASDAATWVGDLGSGQVRRSLQECAAWVAVGVAGGMRDAVADIVRERAADGMVGAKGGGGA